WAGPAAAYGVAGALERGLRFPEAAVATPVPNPAWLSDLSAVYLAVSRQRDRPELLPKALVAAERATRLDARVREASFNKALALEALYLSDLAVDEWKAYARLDPGSPWGQEAAAHVSRLEYARTVASTRWENVARSLGTDPDESLPALDDVRGVRHLLRAWIETTLLPEWA